MKSKKKPGPLPPRIKKMDAESPKPAFANATRKKKQGKKKGGY